MTMDWQSIFLTLKLASSVAAILFLIAVPIAAWIAFSRARFKFLVEAVVAMPLVLPPTVLGFYLLLMLGRQGPLGRAFFSLTGHTFAFSFSGLLVASVIYSLPFAVQPMAAAFTAVDPQLMCAARTLGASRYSAFIRIALPLSVNGVVTGVVLSFAHTVGEFGVVLMVGGNIAGVTRTVSIDIYDRVQSLDYASAQQTSLVLLIFSFVVLASVYAANRHIWRAWLGR